MIASTKVLQGAHTPLDDIRFEVWSPPRSPARIEYRSTLLEEIHRRAGDRDYGGELFGTRTAGGFRILATRIHPHEKDPHEKDPSLAALEPLGIFSSRVRGEVFLTESDLQRLGRQPVALVLIKDRAGFFIREPDGSMITIQSYQEFSMKRAARP